MASKKTTRKKTAGGRRKAGSKKPMPGWVVLLSGVLVGLLLAVFAYVQGWVPQPIGNDQQPIPGSNQQATQVEDVEDVSETLSNSAKKKDYDFYTVLPEMEIVIPKDEINQTIERDNREFTYILQVGSFKNLADAEKLKAKIAFSGQIAHIQSIDVNQTTWHRVRVGPFDSSRKADSVKRQLEKSNLSALMMKEAKKEAG
ncbi:SPOR domain-containing protein [Marinicella sp. W31]|uniref:SPOR domain-containing protein n=1 Tax=Marinicella sp. W31 TaxID=3023713 RepID=UPI003756B188